MTLKIIIFVGCLIIFLLILISIYFITKLLKKKNFNSIDNNYNNNNNNNYNNNNDKIYFEIENFLNDEECNLLINDAKPTLQRSKVMSVNDKKEYFDKIDNVRTSHQTWIKGEKYDNIRDKVENLVNKYSKIPITKKQFEDIQIARYKPNQEYKYHYDICHPSQADPVHLNTCKLDYEKYNSVRYITVILYLNDGYKEGETYFTKLDKKIIPKKGKALIFFNCNYNFDTEKNGLCDVINNSEHAGLPVKEGKTDEKWIANIWIRTKNLY